MTITRRQIVASLGLEAVDFQYNKVFFQELTLAISKVRALTNKSPDNVAKINVGGVIEHHTGIKANWGLEKADFLNAWVYPPFLDINHVLLSDIFRFKQANKDAVAMIRQSKGIVKGSVNRTTGRVTGVFTQFTPDIYVTTACFGVLSDEEIAAVTLHEVGHCMSFFELLGAQMTTNMALKTASDAFMGTTTGEQRYEILMAVEETLNIKFEDKAKLQSATPEVLTTVALKRVIEASRSEGGTPLYDYSGWEFMSDQYAARCGAGRAQVTALDKLHKYYDVAALRNPISHLFLEGMSLVGTLVFAGASTILFGPIGGLIVGIVFLTFDMIVGKQTAQYRIYDSPEARLKRLRNEMVDALKNTKITPKQRQGLLEDLAVVDNVTKAYTDRKGLFEYLYTLFSPSQRQQEREMVIQQELEKLVSNDLYIRAAKLKSLSAS